jgi:hypothetical protein
MDWTVWVTFLAQGALNRLNPTSAEVELVVSLLKSLASNPLPGERVPFIFEQDLLYSDILRFRVIFQLYPSSGEPPGKLKVVGFITTR